MRRTTIKDVAALAGVSPATVSRTLDDRPEISAETKERVRAACAQLGYVPNAAAKGLTGQATHTLGVVVPDVSNPYFTGIATAIEETAAENGYRVLLSNSLQEEGRELRAIENFLARQIDGVLISPLSRESQAKHADLLEGTPCVYLGVNHGEKCSYVMADNEAGAAIAVQGGLDAINGAEWMKVVYGILLSTLLGFGLGWINYKVIGRMCRNVDRLKANSFFKWAQICSGAGVAFMHGAQDGQKFMSIFMLAIMMTAGMGMDLSGVAMPMWLMIFCAFNMGFGTAVGGERIIKSVAMDMVSLEKYQGVAASLSTVITLFVASMTGMPVSPSHCSTASIMGVGASKSFRRVNWGVARRMVWAWVLTFPCCGFIGWALAKLFMML